MGQGCLSKYMEYEMVRGGNLQHFLGAWYSFVSPLQHGELACLYAQ